MMIGDTSANQLCQIAGVAVIGFYGCTNHVNLASTAPIDPIPVVVDVHALQLLLLSKTPE